jgi:hypothetical protein
VLDVAEEPVIGTLFAGDVDISWFVNKCPGRECQRNDGIDEFDELW